jgi:hypothetical protein
MNTTLVSSQTAFNGVIGMTAAVAAVYLDGRPGLSHPKRPR